MTRRDLAHTQHAIEMESHPAGRAYRRELARLGLPRPRSLAGIDLYKQ